MSVYFKKVKVMGGVHINNYAISLHIHELFNQNKVSVKEVLYTNCLDFMVNPLDLSKIDNWVTYGNMLPFTMETAGKGFLITMVRQKGDCLGRKTGTSWSVEFVGSVKNILRKDLKIEIDYAFHRYAEELYYTEKEQEKNERINQIKNEIIYGSK